MVFTLMSCLIIVVTIYRIHKKKHTENNNNLSKSWKRRSGIWREEKKNQQLHCIKTHTRLCATRKSTDTRHTWSSCNEREKYEIHNTTARSLITIAKSKRPINNTKIQRTKKNSYNNDNHNNTNENKTYRHSSGGSSMSERERTYRILSLHKLI